MCAICYNDEKPMNYTISCKHSFHTFCLIQWWDNRDRAHCPISCPMCRYEPSKDEIEHCRLTSLAYNWTKKMSRGEDVVKVWFEKVKRHTYITPMENVLSASEFVPQS